MRSNVVSASVHIAAVFLFLAATGALAGTPSPPVDARTESVCPPEGRRFLLDLARRTIMKYLENGEILVIDEDRVPACARPKRGCFVTLHKGPGKELRGCIGSLLPQEALYKSVIENAVNASTRDGRFPPVKASEMGDILIEVSVLTEPKELSFQSPAELLKKLRPAVDGVILQPRACHSSTFLPQVWEQIPGPESFLSQLCRKGGCDGDCWRKPDLSVLTYQAEYFIEAPPEPPPKAKP